MMRSIGKSDNGMSTYDWGWRKWLSVSVRRELVAPFLLYMDERLLADVWNMEVERLKDQLSDETLGDLSKITSEAYSSIIKKIVPQHLVNDLFNLFYHKSENHEYSLANISNKAKFAVLRGVNDGGLKIVTNGNGAYSQMFAIAIARELVVSILENCDAPDVKSIIKSMSRAVGDFDNSGNGNDVNEKEAERVEQLLKNVLSLTRTEDRIANAKAEVMNCIVQLEKLGLDMDKLTNEYGFSASTLVNDIDNIRKSIEDVEFSRKGLRTLIDKIISKSTGYFSLKSTLLEKPILEADSIGDIDGLEFLHPVFRGTRFEDVTTSERRYYGKMTVYLDVSGSMNTTANISNTNTTLMNFGKSVVLTLFRMGILENLYTFESVVHDPVPLNEVSICLMNGGGGTSIDAVIRHAKKHGDNSLVITDCNDYISEYCENIFIVGTPAATFSLRGEGENGFGNSNQLWIFDNDAQDIRQYNM